MRILCFADTFDRRQLAAVLQAARRVRDPSATISTVSLELELFSFGDVADETVFVRQRQEKLALRKQAQVALNVQLLRRCMYASWLLALISLTFMSQPLWQQLVQQLKTQ